MASSAARSRRPGRGRSAPRPAAIAAGAGDQHRLQHQPELLDAEVVLDLEHRQPDEQPAERQVLQELDERAVRRRVGRPSRRWPSYSSSSTAISDRPAPPISIRCVGPQSVTS